MTRNREKVVVVGGGVAGLMACLYALEQGAVVELVTETPARRSHDVTFQDGIAGVIYPSTQGDSIEQHLMDTVLGGDFLAHQAPVRDMCTAAPSLIRLCDRLGVPFNRTAEGKIRQLRTGGSAYGRTAYCDAATGQQILYALDAQVRHFEFQGRLARFENMMFCSLVLDEDGVCRGIVAADTNSQEFKFYTADAVILCTGGYAGLYGRTTAPWCSGADLAQVYLQGAGMANPEFVQFHPITVACPDKMRPIGEIARAVGARLWVRRNERNWDFLNQGYPGQGSNLPYDIVAREVVQQGDEVNLDFLHIDEDAVDEHVSRLIDLCHKCVGIDPKRSSMAVIPSAHFTMGGLWVDGAHMTTIKGLFAAGECDYQYHGANALGSNVLLSALYGGRVAGREAAVYAANTGRRSGELPTSIFEREQDRQEAEFKDYLDRSEGENPRNIGRDLANIMDEEVGVERNNGGLDAAEGKIDELAERFVACCPSDRSSWANGEAIYTWRLKRQLDLARVVVKAARARDESRGAHFKSSHARRDDKKWAVVTRVKRAESGPKFDYSERINTEEFKPKERRYGKGTPKDKETG